MANYRVAKRYAKGLYDFSESMGKTEEIYKEMQQLASLLTESRELKSFFKSPVLDFKKKQKIAKELFSSFSETTQRFIHLVIGRKREQNLQEIATQYLSFSDQKNGIQKAVFISATELNEKTIQEILEKNSLVKDIKSINLEKKVDTSLIGGYILKVGDKQVDASVKNKLNKLRTEFDENQYIPKF